MYDPELAAHTSIWLAEAELRGQDPANILEEALDSTRAAGYRRVELVSDFLAADLRDRTLGLLARNKLEPSVIFVEGPLYSRQLAEATRRRVKDLAWIMTGRGTRFVNFSPFRKPGEQAMMRDELDTEAYQLNRMGEDLGTVGLDLTVHHHEAEMRDNAREWRFLVANTEPSLVSFCQMQYDGMLVVELVPPESRKQEYSLATDLSLSRWYAQEVFGSRPGFAPVDMGPHVRLHPHP
jgi:sugar phosphate isomerase/epimerase